MSWQKERDLLIAQSTAFVQSVTGKSAHADHRTEAVPPGEAVSAPREALTLTRLAPLKHRDLREEIQQRVAAFRVRQQQFHQERDEYFNTTLARARTVTDRAVTISDRLPPKR